jgi:penicillin-binding protein 1B
MVTPFARFRANCCSQYASVKVSGSVAGPALRRAGCAADHPAERDGVPPAQTIEDFVGLRIRREILVSRWALAIFAAVLVMVLAGGGVFIYYWVQYGRMIDQLLAGHINQTAARIYAAPSRIAVEQALSAEDLVERMQTAGYTGTQSDAATGWFSRQGNAVEIHPGKDSYFAGKNALRVEFAGDGIRRIRNLDNRSALDSAEIEPQLLTNLFDSSREKRRRVRFADIPRLLLNAVLSAEDKRFFEHPGFDIIRIAGAAWHDLRGDSMVQGASTLTMQVARSIFLTPERTWRRKIAETMVALQLEQRFSKEQIFELYANEIYLGNRGSFAIHGFAEGSLAYFNKDIRDLTIPEAAFLAGIIRAPNRYSSAERRPERAAEARDRVLKQMADNRFITPEQFQESRQAALRVVPGGVENSDAPYFVDMVKDHLLDRFSEEELLSQGFRIYTTLDGDLVRAATEAISIGLENVDRQLKARYALWEKQGRPAQAQVAMVVLDPHSGEIKALVGGRNYGFSQLNHVLARRQPGSVFKPFVYAAAFDNAVEGVSPIVTPATTVVDEPTTFLFEDQEYAPNNYGEQFRGAVTLRDALTSSLNVATVKVAELIGYPRVVGVAREFGITDSMLPTPALALGAYEMTPLEVAAAYTVFANGGVRAEPNFMDRVVNAEGVSLERLTPKVRSAVDPRVAYQVTSILEDVINRGTGASVRARGFAGPAAGKTGTSRDGWFAGFTSNLLCIVWVGFDDNRDLGLSGAATAAPIWTEFMKRATALPAYSNLQEFPAPDGIAVLDIDPETLQLATPSCPMTRREVFIQGSAPTEFCERHGGVMLTQTPPISWLSRIFGGDDDSKPEETTLAETPAAATAAAPQPQPATATTAPAPATAARPRRAAQPRPAPPPKPAEPPQEEKKPGLLDRIFGIFESSSSQQAPAK